jgi:hypothetical protein
VLSLAIGKLLTDLGEIHVRVARLGEEAVVLDDRFVVQVFFARSFVERRIEGVLLDLCMHAQRIADAGGQVLRPVHPTRLLETLEHLLDLAGGSTNG